MSHRTSPRSPSRPSQGISPSLSPPPTAQAFSTLQSRVASLEDALEALQAEFRGYRQNYADLSASYTRARDDRVEDSAFVQKLKEQVARNEARQAELRERLDAQRTQSPSRENAALREALVGRDQELAAIKSANDQTVEALKAELADRDNQIAKLKARSPPLQDKDAEIAALKAQIQQLLKEVEDKEVIVAVLTTKVSTLERQLVQKSENEETARLVEENARLVQENKELEQEIYDVQENNPQLQEALADRKKLKSENTELHDRITLLEQQLRGEDQQLLPDAPGDAAELPFKRGVFREWEVEGGGYSLKSRTQDGQNKGLGALFVDAGSDDEEVPQKPEFRPIGENKDSDVDLLGDLDD